jgi:hypothetical protein
MFWAEEERARGKSARKLSAKQKSVIRKIGDRANIKFLTKKLT